MLPISCVGFTDNTPLIDASWQGYDDIVQLLLEKGANVHPIDIDKKSALSYAADEGNVFDA